MICLYTGIFDVHLPNPLCSADLGILSYGLLYASFPFECIQLSLLRISVTKKCS